MVPNGCVRWGPRRLMSDQTWSKHEPQTGSCLWSVWVLMSDEEQAPLIGTGTVAGPGPRWSSTAKVWPYCDYSLDCTPAVHCPYAVRTDLPYTDKDQPGPTDREPRRPGDKDGCSGGKRAGVPVLFL